MLKNKLSVAIERTDLESLFLIIPLKHWKISYPQNWMPFLETQTK